MNLDRIRAIADAVLYEGYLLYPYRPSAIKNRQRWTFGGVFPGDFAGRQGDAASMQAQFLIEGGAGATLDLQLRFLQVLDRSLGRLAEPCAEWPEDREPAMVPLSHVEVEGRDYLAGEEAVAREIAIDGIVAGDLTAPRRVPFAFAAARAFEPIHAADGAIVAALIRTSCAVAGTVEIAAERLGEGLFRLSVRVDNATPLPAAALDDRAQAQRRAFASTHLLAGIRGGIFVSLTDPPPALHAEAAQCDNRGCWPVLVGSEGARDAILAAPIILPDYPQIAPESPGDLFDGTEIDEILTLRILAMTDDEKREMAAADGRTRALLERTHGLTPAQMARLHGTMRRPSGGDLAVGSHVRLRPKPGADIMDIALRDKVATVEAVERDFDDRIHVAVTLLDDPGRDLGAAGFPGHRFYFARDEVELIDGEPA